MKLASPRHGRDGRLVVVSHDLAWYADVALVRQAWEADLPDCFCRDPLLCRGGSDGFLGPRNAIFGVIEQTVTPA